ncbi:MAG: hypothetical protein K0S07_1066 [Chlamydiales bacterium]|nr:hypothetical protein [Chlamydiales bacterium]
MLQIAHCRHAVLQKIEAVLKSAGIPIGRMKSGQSIRSISPECSALPPLPPFKDLFVRDEGGLTSLKDRAISCLKRSWGIFWLFTGQKCIGRRPINWPDFLKCLQREEPLLQDAVLEQNGYLISPLEYAICNQKGEAIVASLLKKGFQARQNTSLLSLAIHSIAQGIGEQKEISSLLGLLATPEAINLQDTEGKTALHHCLILLPQHPLFIGITSLLLERGADFSVLDREEKIARDYLLARSLESEPLREALQFFDACTTVLTLGENFGVEFETLADAYATRLASCRHGLEDLKGGLALLKEVADAGFRKESDEYRQALSAYQTVQERVQGELAKNVASLRGAWERLDAFYALSTRLPQFISHSMERQNSLLCQIDLLGQLYQHNKEHMIFESFNGWRALFLYMDVLAEKLQFSADDPVRVRIRERLLKLDETIPSEEAL